LRHFSSAKIGIGLVGLISIVLFRLSLSLEGKVNLQLNTTKRQKVAL